MDIKEVHNHLKNHDIRPLPHKIAIMQYLLERYDHPTIEQIYNDLLPTMPTLSKTTVYNTLKLFCDNKVATAMAIDERNVRYDVHSRTSTHAHFRCKKCNAIFDVPLKESDIPPCRNSEEFNLEETQVYFFGTCKSCKI